MSTELTAVDAEIGGIEATMRSSMAVYEHDPAMQSRYLALLEAKEAGKAPPPVPASQRERREIEMLMGDSTSRYWKGPDATGLQERYRELIESDEPRPVKWTGSRGDSEGFKALMASAAEDDSDDLAIKLPPGADAIAVAALPVVHDILRELPAATRGEFERVLGGLPSTVLAACREELAAKAPWTAPADPHEVQRFSTTVEGAALVAEWGSAAPARLGRLRGRLKRWLGRMSPADRDSANAWLDSIEPDEAAALYRVVTQ